MAVKIRLKRTGRKNRPFYRMCVFDARTRRDGQPVEELGSYDPRAETLEQKLNINRQRAWYWLSVGAQPSETCNALLRKLGVRKEEPMPVDVPAEVDATSASSDASVELNAAAVSSTTTSEPA